MKINIELLKTQIRLSSELYQKPAYNNEGMKKLIDNYKQILEACMSTETNYKTEVGEYKGNKTISINNGDKRVVSFGLTKAKAILASYEDIKKFVEENDNGGSSNNTTIDMSKLTPEQQQLVQSFIQK